MFVDNFFTDNVIKKIFSKGKIEIVEPIFKEFNSFLEEIGLDVALTTFHLQPKRADLSENRSDNGNDIAIYLRTGDNFIKNSLDANHNWNGKYAHTKDIMEKWKELAKKFNFPITYYDYVAHVFIYDFENIYLTELVSSSKTDLLAKVKKANWKINPEYIFSSSVPAYNIIYDNQKDYDNALAKGYFQELTTLINNVLKTNDILKMYKTGYVEINFYHSKMGINLYGLSRED
jgi:hypothetical protein